MMAINEEKKRLKKRLEISSIHKTHLNKVYNS